MVVGIGRFTWVVTKQVTSWGGLSIHLYSNAHPHKERGLVLLTSIQLLESACT